MPLAVIVALATAQAAKPPKARSKAHSTKARTPKTPPLTREQRAARAMLRSMSLRDRVAQLVIGACYGRTPYSESPEFEKYRHWVRDLHIGGLIVSNPVQDGQVHSAEPYALAVFLNRMQRMSRVPLLIGSDFERGASMRVSDTPRFPYNMAYGAADDVEATRAEGLEAAREARALGVQWIFAPVSDVNSNPANPIINMRSYGEDPSLVARHVAAYIDGAHSDPKNRVLVTAKHFPGHGDTSTDSHLGLALLDQSREHMDAVELKPFEAAIAHGADAIMTAHMAVPAIEPEDIPATVSSKVLTGLLRKDLRFQGLVVTDAMDMLGITNEFKGPEASVRAIQAGADVLLMPPDPEKAIRAVVAAVQKGRISRKRIDESAARVLAAKIRVGLTKMKLVNLDRIADALDSPEAAEMARHISERAITLVRNEGNLVPLATPNTVCVVIAVESRASVSGRRFAREFARRAPAARIVTVDGTMPLAALVADAGDLTTCSEVVVSANVAVAAYKGNIALAGDLTPFVQTLALGPAPVVLVAVGNPYLLTSFPKVAAYLATFSITAPSEAAAVKALFGEIPITGHLPVTIPGFAKFGDGIQLAARTR
ncbi:MAG TPA: glycoside hydrolase family 3 N-terminal domain-containing protein [Bryobacteraceae bacterium]|nr:glycoside hydrolase family 3 N-terminal domain-containing protein [Bryobacteraceae bacterium]